MTREGALCTVAITIAFFAAAEVASADPVTFVVDVPHCTPPGSTIFLRSNRIDPGNYVHDALERISATRWEGTFDVTTPASSFRYKYSHSLCDAMICPGIEKDLMFDGNGADRPDRELSAGATRVEDLVYVWRSTLTTVSSSGVVTGVRPNESRVAFCAPYLGITDTDGTMTIGYDSYDAGHVVLELGTSTAYGMRFERRGQHRNQFPLPNLVPGETYHYRIVENGIPLEDRTFRALPAPSSPLRFALIGDTQFYNAQQRSDFSAIASTVAAFDPHVVLSPGDMVASEHGTTGPGGWAFPEMGRWSVFFDTAAPLMSRAPWMAAMGNHEEDGFYFWDAFAFPEPDAPRVDHYFFVAGNVHFTVLYTGSTDGYDLHGILGSQTPWLARVLADAARDPRVRYKVVLLHRGPLSEGTHHMTDGRAFWETRVGSMPSWRDLFMQHDVDLVLAGHNHNFTLGELEGVRYITSCGGAPVHNQRGPESWGPTTIHAEKTCAAVLLTAGPQTIDVRVVRTNGSAMDPAAFSLCHEASDCDGVTHSCAGAPVWSCERRACRARCDADAGVRDAGVDAGAPPPPSAGCGCRVASPIRGEAMVAPLLFALVALTRSRRRR